MVSCATFGCLNSSKKKGLVGKDGKKVTVRRFPIKDKRLLNEWLARMKRNDFGMPYKPNVDSRMCSEHFVESDFTFQLFTDEV